MLGLNLLPRLQKLRDQILVGDVGRRLPHPGPVCLVEVGERRVGLACRVGARRLVWW